MTSKRLKICARCGVKPVLEKWTSAGAWFAVRCNNPDRGDGCDYKFYASKSRSPEEAIQKWNELN